MPKFLISASILSADFARLGEEVKQVIQAGADLVHVDVMDNHYVPNLTFGPIICEALRHYNIKAPLDVHLMVKPVDRIIPDFAAAGADMITFHPEASEHIHRTIQLIHHHQCKAGLAFNPATSLHYLDHVIHDIDLVLIMTVNPGFGGQQFIPGMLDKIFAAKEKIVASGKNILLAVDGGINPENIAEVAKAGADMFIMGSALFNSYNYEETIELSRENLQKVF